MNKTVSVNINGYVFNIEEEAYAVLKEYLLSLERIFSSQKDAKEIISDIESRIAELFNEDITDQNQVVTQLDVDNVIEVLGKPEDYEMAEEGFQSSDKAESQFETADRKLYRDPDGSFIGGVCSGLTHFLNWNNPLYMRLIFIIMAFSSISIFVYLILYLLVPEAKTSSEKLHMKGERINLHSIKNNVMEGQDSSQSNRTGIKGLIKNITRIIENVFQLIGKFISKAIGLVFLGFGVFILFGTIFFFVSLDTFLSHDSQLSLGQLESIFVHGSGYVNMALIGFGLIIFSLLFLFLFHGIRIVFGLYQKVKGLNLTCFGLMLLGIILLVSITISNVQNHTHSELLEEEINFSLSSDSLYIGVLDDPYFNENVTHHNSIFSDLISLENDRVVFGYPIHLNIYRSDQDEMSLEVGTFSTGSSIHEVFENIEDVQFEWFLRNDSLMIAPFLSIDAQRKFHAQEVRFDLFIPDSIHVKESSNLERIHAHYRRKFWD